MSDPIPAEVWDRMKAWLEEGRTGTITLGVNQGRVKDYEIREFGKVSIDKARDVCTK